MEIGMFLKDGLQLYVLPGGVLALVFFILLLNWGGLAIFNAVSMAMLVWAELIAIAFFFEDLYPMLVRRREQRMSMVGGVLAIVAGLLSFGTVLKGSLWWSIGAVETIGLLVLACGLLSSKHADRYRAILSVLWTGLWLVAFFFVTAHERGSDFVLDLSLNLASALIGLWLVRRYALRITGSTATADA